MASAWEQDAGRVGAEWGQMAARWVQHGFCWGHFVGLGSRFRGSRIGCSAEQTNEATQRATVHGMAAAVASVAGGRLLARGRVRMAILEFLTPKEARKSCRQCHQEMVILGLTGWQTDMLVVCNGRVLSLRGLSARDPATADAAECALAAGRGAASASAAAVWG